MNDLASELAYKRAQRAVKFAMDDGAKTLNPPAVTGGGDALDPEIKAKRKKLRDLIRYHKDQDAWLVSRRGIHSQSDLNKVKEYEAELGQLGSDEDCDLLVTPAANDASLDDYKKALAGLRRQLQVGNGAMPQADWLRSSEAADLRADIKELEWKIANYRGNDAANDHAYTVARIGQYQILEGAGTDGGSWFAKGRGENKRFKSRREAEEHAQHSQPDANDAGPLDVRTDETLIAQINTALRLQNKPEIKKGQHSRQELEALYRKVNA